MQTTYKQAMKLIRGGMSLKQVIAIKRQEKAQRKALSDRFKAKAK